MELTLLRYHKDTQSTLGLLYVNGKFQTYSLEDPVRLEKIKHRTAIPAGTYKIKYRKTNSPMTKKYRERFPHRFTYHLELQDVPNYKYVYMHIGNGVEDTSGCIILGDAVQSQISGSDKLSLSTQAFLRIYDLISSELNRGGEVTITIKDINN
jgi:hypothetical protein